MKEDKSSPEIYKLLDYIHLQLIENGLKATTMDSIASSYRISKRTLYEIFGNKENMIEAAINHWRGKTADHYREIFSSSDNIMEIILRCFLYNREIMAKTSLEFYRDFHEFIKKTRKNLHEKNIVFQEHLRSILQRGINEGYFRLDINLEVLPQMINIQMEALRRMEELFPEWMSPLEVYDSIITTFLRGISTEKGKETLDMILNNIGGKQPK